MLGVREAHIVEIDLERGVVNAAHRLVIGGDPVHQLARRAHPRRARLDLGLEGFALEGGDDLVVALVVGRRTTVIQPEAASTSAAR